jgi:Flp pilus assembly protein TadG
MLRIKQLRKSAPSRERGATLPEMALSGVLFFTLMFGIVEIGRLMAAYNALAEAARRGVRYACMNTAASTVQVQNMVVYGTPTAGASPIAPGLTTGNVFVTYTANYGVNSGSVVVEIKNYQFNVSVPFVGANYLMRPFTATANAENAGVIPGNI